MIKKLKNIYNASMIFSIILAIIGLIMIIIPNISLDIICKLLAIYLIIQGVFFCYMNFCDRAMILPFEIFGIGVLSIIMGIVIFIHPNYLETILGILVGIWIILQSITDISISISLKNTKAPWLLTLLLASISILAGIILLFNPEESASALIMWIGIILLINSISSLIDKIIFKKYMIELENRTKEIFKLLK